MAPSRRAVVDVFKPEWFREDYVTQFDMNVVSVFWGAALALAVFTFGKAARQTARSWARHRRITAYLAMVWGAWITNLVPSAVTWFHFYGKIPSRHVPLPLSFWLFLFIVVSWSFQIQFLMQIIINRISLLIIDPQMAQRLKWAVFSILLCLSTSVTIIWIPASLQISQTWHDANAVWDRAKQAVLMIMDVCLNGYFLYCVRNRLIANGLRKYRSLFRFNTCMVFVIVALDVTFIGLMSLDLSTAYLQFQPVAYLTKLYIEMNMSELIRKIVKSTNELNRVGYIATINGVPVSLQPHLGSPASELQGLNPGDRTAARQQSGTKPDIEVGVPLHPPGGAGSGGAGARSSGPGSGFYATVAEAPDADGGGNGRAGRGLESDASSTIPLRPRSRSREDAGKYSLGV
ncbi:hypothetical protein DL766_000446 [Monosporascus sp. MC13-8B]|uniref:Integral membrane protein n=1 Tax=Monosporascus cannonballus TaxID=155416 RepID=A0ABY0H6N5_9PEZI|nr:hypothetical protein DL762_005211 [Monosporascus cannonballus]RYP00207.1 hypothetical protein DL763_000976 [Monosporascus cannonballus]RYP39294.1 hypothetical protein DL766_000446 [Monosporascus sp. MC13-8B]